MKIKILAGCAVLALAVVACGKSSSGGGGGSWPDNCQKYFTCCDDSAKLDPGLKSQCDDNKKQLQAARDEGNDIGPSCDANWQQTQGQVKADPAKWAVSCGGTGGAAAPAAGEAPAAAAAPTGAARAAAAPGGSADCAKLDACCVELLKAASPAAGACAGVAGVKEAEKNAAGACTQMLTGIRAAVTAMGAVPTACN